MRFQSFLVLLGPCTAVTHVDLPTGTTEDGALVEAASMGLERIIMRLDKLILKLVGVGSSTTEQHRAVDRRTLAGPVVADSKRVFGIPVKTNREWRKLTERIKREERMRDMKHWK